MLALAMLTAGLVHAAASDAPHRNAARNCTAGELVAAGFAPADFKRLDELPPAWRHLAVIRSVGGCFVATIKVRDQVYWAPLVSNGEVVPLRPPERKPLQQP